MRVISLLLTVLISAYVHANDQNCIPEDWDGYWNGSIKSCFLEDISYKERTIKKLAPSYFDDAELFSNTKTACNRHIRELEFQNELAEEGYFACLQNTYKFILNKLTKNGVSTRLNELIDWEQINVCRVTYLNSNNGNTHDGVLKKHLGWDESELPKIVIDGNCQLKVTGVDSVILYEGTETWTNGKYFFYIKHRDGNEISVSAQPNPTYSHAQWNVSDSVKLISINNTQSCLGTAQIKICMSQK